MNIITAALIYANGPIHLGHIKSTYLPADIYYKYLKIKGEQALFICATDDHGTPIVIEAEKRGIGPKQLVEYYHQKDLEEFKRLGIEFDIFHWTSSQENKFTTLEFYQALRQFIYSKKVTQYYCEELSKFMPDRYVKGKCKYCGAPDQYADQCENCGKTLQVGDLLDPYCTITNTRPKLKDSEHLFFKLSHFANFLREYNIRVADSEIYNYLKGWLDDLQDWDIVRDLNWGIPVPDLPGKVFYVWFDAPIGYIGSLRALRKDWRELWNNSKVYHFIGKDIIYHHYLFWPAMLYGANMNLPYKIPVRGYLTLEGKKFSKSRGWFLSLESTLDHIHPDYIRYYMTSISPSGLVDSDFSFNEFKSKINNELIANYGNLVSRILRLWNGKELDRTVMDQNEREAYNRYTKAMDDIRLKDGLEIAMELAGYYNKMLTEKEPWKLEYQDAKNVISKVLYGTMFVTKMLYPFIPFTTSNILRSFGQEINLNYPDRIIFGGQIVPFKKLDAELDMLRQSVGR